jgi:muconolactone delta-isomerase
MQNYMITIRISENIDDDFISKIPLHRAMVNKLMNKGVILSYTLNSSRTILWIVMDANHPSEIEHHLQTLPLYNYFDHYDMESLMFHNVAGLELSNVSLN